MEGDVIMNRWAIIRGNAVENVVLWDGDTTSWQPPNGTVAVEAPAEVSVGWT